MLALVIVIDQVLHDNNKIIVRLNLPTLSLTRMGDFFILKD